MTRDVVQSIDKLRQHMLGREYLTDWAIVEQQSINEFASSTADPDPMHIDVEWTRQHTPYPGTIAQGLWVASMLVKAAHDTGLAKQAESVFSTSYGLNYGFDSLRFIRPLLVGAQYRSRLVPLTFDMKTETSALIRIDASVQIKAESAPAIAGEWLLLFVSESGGDNE